MVYVNVCYYILYIRFCLFTSAHSVCQHTACKAVQGVPTFGYQLQRSFQSRVSQNTYNFLCIYIHYTVKTKKCKKILTVDKHQKKLLSLKGQRIPLPSPSLPNFVLALGIQRSTQNKSSEVFSTKLSEKTSQVFKFQDFMLQGDLFYSL